MTRHRFGAIAACLALGLTSMAPAAGMAQSPPPATAASLQASISAAAASAARTPGFARMSPAQKQATLQAAIAAALAESGASPTLIAAALITAVGNGTISAGVAVSVAADVSPQMAQTVASAPVVVAQAEATGQSVTVTNVTDGSGNVSILVSLQGATTPSSGDSATGSTTPTAPAPYDPCAGVIGAYCGS
ncbi:hypothetical protein CSW58_10135 [Caulobacter sp. B11]|uniref:hypothetical protein n=1 Tax=Caulobacter sp. B11 TaxID=2048899 RepID=UPI000C12C555|nr:hypothetical protein [Caulobacter sp. B11]PHY12802.1 hypothetical protein CSW58_10135 [Caulobacter sp. B11]